MKKALYTAAVLFVIFLLIIEGENAIAYAREAIGLCLDMIIPSLFPFFICSGILIYSGFCQKLALLFEPVMRPLFNVNANGSSAFVLGIISGYPLGAVTACDLYKTGYISKSETERLLAFCNNSGPLFIIGSVGIGLYAGVKTGIILYISHLIASILVGICMRSHAKEEYSAPPAKLSTDEKSFAEIFKISTVNATNNMLIICGTILFFSVSSRLVLGLLPFEVPPFLYGLFEFSSGNIFMANSPYPIPVKLVLSSVITGFAGLSVHMQVLAAVAGEQLSMKPYIMGKIMHGLFSGALTGVLVFATGARPVFGNISLNYSGGFMMAAVYLTLCTAAVAFLMALLHMRKGVSLK